MAAVFGGNGVDDAIPIAFLKSRGYTLTKHWFWILPKPDHHVTDKESLCINFLIDEWDFGGIAEHES